MFKDTRKNPNPRLNRASRLTNHCPGCPVRHLRSCPRSTDLLLELFDLLLQLFALLQQLDLLPLVQLLPGSRAARLLLQLPHTTARCQH